MNTDPIFIAGLADIAAASLRSLSAAQAPETAA